MPEDTSTPLPFVGLGQRLKFWMERASINAEELGPKLSVDRSAVVNWREGRYRPDAKKLSSIATALDLSADEAVELYALAGSPLPASVVAHVGAASDAANTGAA